MRSHSVDAMVGTNIPCVVCGTNTNILDMVGLQSGPRTATFTCRPCVEVLANTAGYEIVAPWFLRELLGKAIAYSDERGDRLMAKLNKLGKKTADRRPDLVHMYRNCARMEYNTRDLYEWLASIIGLPGRPVVDTDRGPVV